jgi:fructokinase
MPPISQPPSSPPWQIVGLGEILWDVFPDGPRFGGAPANAACSAAELAKDAAEVFMVSGMGDDALGSDAVAALHSHGVSTSHVQRNSWPTGRVDVTLDAVGMASYRFAEDSAWDHVAWCDALKNLAARCDAVCFGTLGQRGQTSRDTIHQFVATVKATNEAALRVLDINLRPPYDDDTVILESLELANVLKLNDDELPRVCQLCGISAEPEESLARLAQRYQLRAVAVTRSSKGGLLIRGAEMSDLPGTPVTVADTVGAGDAYTAAMILGLLNWHDAASINAHAIAVASFACTQPGGTMTFPESLCLRPPAP